ncbi:MAG: SseB family protein [Eubacterium sp.]|nr:SseB family protein [Eubacterium sp.]
MDLKRTIAINQLYPIVSSLTNSLYLDDKAMCYCFLSPASAEQFVKETPDTEVPDYRYSSLDQLKEDCFRLGASSIYVNIKSGDENKDYTEISLNPKHMELGYYNVALNRYIRLFVQTKKSKYLYAMRYCNFIIPAKFKDDSSKLVYSTVKVLKNNHQYFLAFSDKKEYEKWGADRPEWVPLRVTFQELDNICGKHGIFINPLGDKFIVSPSKLDRIRDYDDCDEGNNHLKTLERNNTGNDEYVPSFLLTMTTTNKERNKGEQ